MNLLKFCVFVALVAAASAANATFTINIVQSGPDVVMTGSGSIDTTGFPGSLGLSSCGILTGAVSVLVVGRRRTLIRTYSLHQYLQLLLASYLRPPLPLGQPYISSMPSWDCQAHMFLARLFRIHRLSQAER